MYAEFVDNTGQFRRARTSVPELESSSSPGGGPDSGGEGG